MKLNLPNKLTLLRLLLIPFFVLFYLNKNINNFFIYIALIIFVAASLTDFLDGYIARKYNLVSNFGKLMDPLADKTLVCTALILLSFDNIIPLWTVLIVIFREFLISGFRLIAVEKNIVISASIYGKYKTALTMISIVIFLSNIYKLNIIFNIISYFIYYLAIILTIISLIDYLYKNKNIILDGNM